MRKSPACPVSDKAAAAWTDRHARSSFPDILRGARRQRSGADVQAGMQADMFGPCLLYSA
jgi:hypothetical protein